MSEEKIKTLEAAEVVERKKALWWAFQWFKEEEDALLDDLLTQSKKLNHQGRSDIKDLFQILYNQLETYLIASPGNPLYANVRIEHAQCDEMEKCADCPLQSACSFITVIEDAVAYAHYLAGRVLRVLRVI